MDWIQFAIFMLSLAGLFFWNRSEANSDRRDLANAINSDRKDMLTVLKGIQDEMKDFHQKYMEETRDFHGRLCAIEERNKPKII